MQTAKFSLVAIILLGVGLQAVRIRESSAADNPLPAKSDPLLANLKTTAKAEWIPDSAEERPKPPLLRILVDFQGTAADQATAFGELKIDSLLDEHGRSYRWQCESSPGELMTHAFQRPNRPKEEKIYFELLIPNHPPIQSIRELRGSIALQTGGRRETVLIKDAIKDLGRPVNDENLKALGIELTITRRQRLVHETNLTGKSVRAMNDVVIAGELDRNVIANCELLDAQGRPIERGLSGFYGNRTMRNLHQHGQGNTGGRPTPVGRSL